MSEKEVDGELIIGQWVWWTAAGLGFVLMSGLLHSDRAPAKDNQSRCQRGHGRKEAERVDDE